MKRAIIALLIIAVVGAGAGAYYITHNGSDVTVNTSPVTRGELIDTVGATGTLQAVITVQVGSQVSGNIAWLGADFNSIVHKGQVIAKLDPALFEAAVAQARANLGKAKADVEHNKVALTDAQIKYKRTKELADRKLLPQSDLDAAKIAVDEAEATLQSSQAIVVQSEANLNQAQVNLDHCTITAPIDGIIIQRAVDVGQTVAASMQAPTLFIIAADLMKMQVNANIDEADVGRIRPGQTVIFKVDAYPTDQFTGTVAQIRLQPIVVQNVTTYGTIVNVPNNDLRLKPGMTANLKVQIARRDTVVKIPNAALRFRPSAEVFAALQQAVPPEAQYAGGRGGGRGGQGGRGSGAGQGAAASLQQGQSVGGNNGPGGRGGGFGGGRQGAAQPGAQSGAAAGSGGTGDDADRQARMLERFKKMSPQEQRQFIDRLKSRGQNTAPFELAMKQSAPAKNELPKSALMTKYGAPQSAETIDALFAPLPSVDTAGRAWLYVNKTLKPVNMRLGITDGTNTELLSGELQPGAELVTGVVLGNARATTAGTGNPLMPGRGGQGGFGGPGGGGRGR
jgi:HlyD family secretion protein